MESKYQKKKKKIRDGAGFLSKKALISLRINQTARGHIKRRKVIRSLKNKRKRKV